MGKTQARVALFAATVASVLCGFHILLLSHAPMTFNDHFEDLSYGWYVPIFSIYVLWRERRELCASIGAPSLAGLVATLPFLMCGLLGVRGIQVRFEILGFAGLLWTLSWAFFGWQMAKRTLFPAMFLLFCMPLATYLDIVTVHLRLLASSTAYGLLRGVGLDVVRQGTMLLSGDGAFAIDIAEPCSGLRSLFAMVALTAGYAYFTQPTWARRALLLALSVPIAVLGNVMRIVSIAVVGLTCSQDFATGFYHDYSGYVVFFVAIALMLATGGAIDKACALLGLSKAAAGNPAREGAAQATGGAIAIPLLAAALVICAMAFQATSPAPVLAAAPRAALGELAGFESETLEPSEAELTTLPADTRFDKRLYRAEDGNWYQVTMVFGGKSKSSIHRPELCLPSQGFQMMSPHNLAVGGTQWRALSLMRRDAAPMGFAYTFFNQEGMKTASHISRIFRDIWDRSVHNRIDRWVMVTVNASVSDDARLGAFLSKLEGYLK